MRKMKYIIGILLLFMVIGFATVTVTLSISGNAKILSDVDDFKVYFSDVRVNDVQNLTLVKSETELSFEFVLDQIGTTYNISYDITNASRMFDASLSISCTQGNEYLSVINEFDTSNLLASTTRTGTLALKKLKSNASETDINYSVTCSLDATPVERDSEASGDVSAPLQSLSAMSEDEVTLGGISASPWTTVTGVNLETLAATNTLFKASFLTEASSVIPKASLLVAYDSEGATTFDEGDLIKVQNKNCYTKENDNTAIFQITWNGWQSIDETDAIYWCEEGAYSELLATWPVTSSYDSFTIPEDQSTHANLVASDWMTAISYVPTPENLAAHLMLNHMLSKVTFKIYLSDQLDAETTITNLKVYSLGSKLIRKPNHKVEVANIEPYGISAYKENDYTFIAYISPGEYKSQDKFISVVIEGEEFEVLIPENIKLESGNHYTFDLKVGKQIINLSSIDVVDWSERSFNQTYSASQLATISDNTLVGGTVGLFFSSTSGSERYEGENIQYSYNEGEWILEGTQVLAELNGSSQKVWGYSNYIDEYPEDGLTISLPETYGSNYEDYDYLYAKPTSVNCNPLPLTMEHMLSKVNVTIQSISEVFDDDQIHAILIKNIDNNSKFNIETNTWRHTGETNHTIALYDTGESYSGYIIPNGATNLEFEVVFVSGRTKTITVELGEEIQSGNLYKIGLNI